MHLGRLDLIYWVAAFVGHVAVMYVLLRRGGAVRFPIFTSLIALSIARSIVLYLVLQFGTSSGYRDVYWSFAIVDTALQFGVLYELASYTFRPLGRWVPYLHRHLIWLISMSMAIALGLTWLASPPASRWAEIVVLKGNFFSAVCMSELFVGLLALSATAGLPWRAREFKIASGLGVFSMTNVVLGAGRNYFGMGSNNRVFFFSAHIRIGVYLCCLAYWSFALWSEGPVPREMTNEMRLQLHKFGQKVNFNLQRLRAGRQP